MSLPCASAQENFRLLCHTPIRHTKTLSFPTPPLCKFPARHFVAAGAIQRKKVKSSQKSPPKDKIQKGGLFWNQKKDPLYGRGKFRLNGLDEKVGDFLSFSQPNFRANLRENGLTLGKPPSFPRTCLAPGAPPS